mgnify:CR=1 FL=1
MKRRCRRSPPPHPAPEVLVLAVGDVADSLVGLEALQPGVRVLKASGSREALDLLVRHDVAVAIVDVQMPDMSGFELAELMRGAARTRAVPIIFLTAATPEPGRVLRGDEAGGIDFLVKPVDPHLLRSKVGVFIELSRQRLLLSAQVEQLHALQRTSELLMGVLDHDLRNPLNAISLAAETLLLARPDDEMAALIARRIRAASQRMSRLIAQGLDFAALRSGSWPIQARDADLDQLCRTAASEFEELNKRGFDCGVQGDPRGVLGSRPHSPALLEPDRQCPPARRRRRGHRGAHRRPEPGRGGDRGGTRRHLAREPPGEPLRRHR